MDKNQNTTWERLRELYIEKAVVRKSCRLSSGKESNYYIDSKKVLLTGEGALCVAEIILEMIKSKEIDAIGGLTMGADPIAIATSLLAFQKGMDIKAFLVRKDPKAHGLMQQIEGEMKPGARVVIVDDVVTSGGSIEKAVKAVEERGCKIERVIAVVNRGDSDQIPGREKKYKLETVFTLKDLELNDEFEAVRNQKITSARSASG